MSSKEAAASPDPKSETHGEPGTKDDRKESDESSHKEPSELFQQYSALIDAHHNLNERIVKISRDITIESKRVIFLLHRIDSQAKFESITFEARQKLQDVIKNHWKRIAQELNDRDSFRYLRAYSPGLQEFIEASSFLHYLLHGKLITLHEIQEQLAFPIDDRTINVMVPLSEFVLGVCDLLGELMRWSINAMGRGETDVCFQTCTFLRSLLDSLLSLNAPGVRDLYHKLQSGRQSLKKVEMACYALQIRGQEVPKEFVLAQAEFSEPVMVEYYD